MALQIIKNLFPTKKIVNKIARLIEQSSDNAVNDNNIFISIEKDTDGRLFTSFAIDDLAELYIKCPVLERNLYEVMPPTKVVKAYLDFEYYTATNVNISDYRTPTISCLKIFYHICSAIHYKNNECESTITSALQQILVLEASTQHKISYHFIDADPTVLFKSNQVFGVFIKVYMHILLTLALQHKCSSFDLQFDKQKSSILELISSLSPYIHVLQKNCMKCYLLNTNISVADVANIIVLNKSLQYVLAIDLNVYTKYQQFRLFDSVKRNQTNNLKQSQFFPYQNNCETLYFNILQKSIITYNSRHQEFPLLSFDENTLQFYCTDINGLLGKHKSDNLVLNTINNHFDQCLLLKTNLTSCHTFHQTQTHRNISDKYILLTKTEKTFIPFVETMITKTSSNTGYIQSCVRGSYRKSLLFFNIAGKYRYCPKKHSHHQHNTVAILIDTKNLTYAIRCKDYECNNTELLWQPIPMNNA